MNRICRRVEFWASLSRLRLPGRGPILKEAFTRGFGCRVLGVAWAAGGCFAACRLSLSHPNSFRALPSASLVLSLVSALKYCRQLFTSARHKVEREKGLHAQPARQYNSAAARLFLRHRVAESEQCGLHNKHACGVNIHPAERRRDARSRFF